MTVYVQLGEMLDVAVYRFNVILEAVWSIECLRNAFDYPHLQSIQLNLQLWVQAVRA